MAEKLDGIGPFRVTIEYAVTDPETGATGWASYSAGAGKLVERGELDEIRQSVLEALPEGMRLMNRHEFYNHIIHELTGTDETFAIPGPKEFESDDE